MDKTKGSIDPIAERQKWITFGGKLLTCTCPQLIWGSGDDLQGPNRRGRQRAV
jgi:hypothetical protein